MGYRLDERYCQNCKADTRHKIIDSTHERDSSSDWRECEVCHWEYSGMTGEYSPPPAPTLEERVEALEKIQIRAVELLSPKAGEVILLTLPEKMRTEDMQQMANGFKRVCGPNVRIICVRDGINVKVIAADEAPKEERESPIAS